MARAIREESPMPDRSFQSGRRARVKATGERRVVEWYAPGVSPPIGCVGDDRLYFPEELESLDQIERPDELSPADAAEIYYAMDSKLKAVRDGLYGDDSVTAGWTDQLTAILAKIGPDGCRLAGCLLRDTEDRSA